jgi:hypothetical protein
MLSKAGVLYPRCGRPTKSGHSFGHHLIVRAAAQLAAKLHPGSSEAAKLFDELFREIEERNPQRVILSSEEFCSLPDLSVLAAQLDGWDVEIVVCLRRQDEFLNAMYYTSICEERHGMSPEAYAETTVKTLLDYNVLLQRWRAAFPKSRIHVRLFERGLSPRIDAVQDFLKVVSIKNVFLIAPDGKREHQTLPARVVAALREIMRGDLSALEFFHIFEAAQTLYASSTEETLSYRPAFCAALLAEYDTANRVARKEFYDGKFESLFLRQSVGNNDTWSESVLQGDKAVAKFVLELSTKVLRMK